MVICLKQGAHLHMAQLMPVPLTVSCFNKNPDWFYLSENSIQTHTRTRAHTHTHIHTHTHPFNDPFSGPTQVSRYQKGKANLDFTEARDCDWQWHPLGHMQVCTYLQSDNHASNPPISFFTGRMPFLPPNQQRQSTEGTKQHTDLGYKLYEMVLIGGGLGGKQCLLSLVVLQLFLQPDKLTTSLLLYHQSMQ